MQSVSPSIVELAIILLMLNRYKPDVRLRFVTEELGFESDEESAQFILDQAGDTSATILQEKDSDVRLLTGKAGAIFESARANAFRNVDIKGQI